MEHEAEENNVGQKIWPARAKVRKPSKLDEEINPCEQLSCEKTFDKLAW